MRSDVGQVYLLIQFLFLLFSARKKIGSDIVMEMVLGSTFVKDIQQQQNANSSKFQPLLLASNNIRTDIVTGSDESSDPE